MKDVLIKARELISEPEHWIRGHNSLDSAGNYCSPVSPDAHCFCLMGAIMRVAPKDWVSPAEFLKEKYLDNTPITAFNDSHSHVEVLELLDKAIKELP